MSETQVLMTVSDFGFFFLGIISWKEALLFIGVGESFLMLASHRGDDILGK